MLNSPLDQFEVNLLIGFNSSIINLDAFNLTNFSYYSLISLLIISFLTILSNNQFKLMGSRAVYLNIALYSTVVNMVKNQIGGSIGQRYVPFIYTLFILILTINLISMIPYSFALSSHIIFIVGISLSIWLGVTIIGLTIHKLNFFSFFVPAGCPLALIPLLAIIELISYLARSVSLGLRLSANVLSGHLLLAILSNLVYTLMSISIIYFIIGFIPLLSILCIVILEFGISMIQAYVFCILTSSYIKDSLYLH